MATRIIEYGGTGLLMNAFPVVPSEQFVAEQAAMTATASSVQSAAVSAATALVCVQSDEAIYVKVALNPTATTNSYRLQAGGEQFFSVTPNASWKIAIRT